MWLHVWYSICWFLVLWVISLVISARVPYLCCMYIYVHIPLCSSVFMCVGQSDI